MKTVYNLIKSPERKQKYEKTRFTAQHNLSRLIACLRCSSDNYSSLPAESNRKRFLYACRRSKPDIRPEILPRQETAIDRSDCRCILRNERGYSDKPKFHRRCGDFRLRSYLLFHSIFADAKAPTHRLYPRNYNIYPHSAVYDVLTAS